LPVGKNSKLLIGINQKENFQHCGERCMFNAHKWVP